MIENKRFMLDDAGELMDLYNHQFIGYGDEVCNLLNELYEENNRLEFRIRALEMEKRENYFKQDDKTLKMFYEENQQLQERNDRQVERLNSIYRLIENEDWKTLKGIIQEFQECEERLKQEWRCYIND